MKKLLIFLTFGIFILSQSIAFAQRDDSKDKDRWEKYRAEKVAFLTTNLDLSPQEAQKFWPVYNQLQKEKSLSQEKRRNLEHKLRDAEQTLSDKEIITLTREYASSMEKEGVLNTKYNEDFLKILPPKKVLKLYQVENEFRMYMFRKARDRGKDSH